MSSIQITHGLTQSPNVLNIPSTDIESMLKHSDDIYEITFNNDKHCRAYVDLDGKMDPSTDELDFTMKNDMILSKLSEIDFGTPVSICTSSKHNNKNWKATKEYPETYTHKLSYSLVFTNKKGSKEAVQNWTRDFVAPLLKTEMIDIIAFHISGVDKECPLYDYIDYDNSVYRKNGKMRCLYSTKPNEERPKVLYSEHTVLDTCITYVPDDCEALPEPSKKKEKSINVVVKAPTVLIKEAIDAVSTDDEPDVLSILIDSLNINRWNNYKDFITIGMVCKNEDIPFEVWERNAKKGSKNKPGDCKKHWIGFKKGSLTQRSLWAMLKVDDFEKFKELCPKRSNDYAWIIAQSHYTTAEVFYNLHPYDYLYEESSGWWHMLPSKMWENTGKAFPSTMRNKVTRAIYTEILECEKALLEKMAQVNNGDDAEKIKNETGYLQTQQKKCIEMKKLIQTDTFVKSSIAFMSSFYAEQTYELLTVKAKKSIQDVMNGNPYLFAFEDALFDLVLQEDGKPIGRRAIEATDYITLGCGYKYPTANKEVRQQIKQTLYTIWENKEMVEYILNLFATCMCGVRDMEAFFIFTGNGRNGKGLLFELLKSVLGAYYYQLPVVVLTQAIDGPGSANPHKAQMAGKRLVCATEPEANERLLEGTIKAITGGDEIDGRMLYGNPISFKPQCMLGIQANIIPLFNKITKAGVLRNRVIPFPFCFVNEPSLSYERKGNPNIKNVLCKSNEWRDEMILMLLECYENVRGKAIDAIKTPSMVQDRTDEYISENNAIGVWWKDNYEIAEEEYVLSKDAFQAFCQDTHTKITDKLFKSGLEFNDIEIKKLSKGGDKAKMGIINWKRKQIVEPGSDDEKRDEEFAIFKK